MNMKQNLVIVSLVMLATFVCGCRAHPVSLAMMLVGDAVSDADVKQREPKLMGQGLGAADAMFGPRTETLVDTRDSNRAMLVYPVQGDLLSRLRYVVEASDGRIVALSKSQQNIDGAEDAIKTVGLKDKLIGKTPEACQREAEFGSPLLTLRSQDSGDLVHVYDVRSWTNLRGARYCVVRFDSRNRCHDVKLVGVSASTKEDPAGG